MRKSWAEDLAQLLSKRDALRSVLDRLLFVLGMREVISTLAVLFWLKHNS